MKSIFSLFVILHFLTACGVTPKSESETKTPEPPPAPKEAPLFWGKISYSTDAEGPDKDLVKAFDVGSPSLIELWNTEGGFKIIETGGLFEGNIVMDKKDKSAWWLLDKEKKAEKCVLQDLEATDPQVKGFMGNIFAPPVLKATGEKETILGKSCDIFIIEKSHLIKPKNTGKVWLWTEMNYPKSRYDFQTSTKRCTTPPPLNLNQENGVILKLEILDMGVNVTYTATELNMEPIPSNVFEIPNSYKKVEPPK